MAKHANLIYALKEGTTVSVEEVERGLKCGCVCPACGAPLVARKGAKLMHHFAHHGGDSCEYGYETSLHLAAKEILSKAKKMIIPPVYVHFPDSPKKDELVCNEKEVPIERVELEKRVGDIIPDVVVYSGGKRFLVEVFVTHAIDDKKLKKIEKENISTIEIDLSDVEEIFVDDFSEIVLGSSSRKTWKYNVIAKKNYQRFLSVVEERFLIDSPFITHELQGRHVESCPIECRKWQGRPYASFERDCKTCQYFFSYIPPKAIKCLGKERIAALKDFNIPLEQRIQRDNAILSQRKRELFKNERCPNCYGRLTSKKGKWGAKVWSCRNFPDCRFTTGIDLNR